MSRRRPRTSRASRASWGRCAGIAAAVLAWCVVGALAQSASGATIAGSTWGNWDPIEQALAASYVDTDTWAGFGEYSLYLCRRPNLYSTYAMIHILWLLDPTRLDADALAEGINGFQTPDGAYLDPDVFVPEWGQTRWACWTLRLLERPPGDLAGLAAYLLSLRRPDGLFQCDEGGQIWDLERDSADMAQILLAPWFESVPEVQSALADLTDYVVGQLSALADLPASGNIIWNSDRQGRSFWGLLHLVSLLAPDLVPDAAREVLRLAIESPPAGRPNFYTARTLYSLVQWARSLVPELAFDESRLRDYVVGGLEPALQPLQGFGWEDSAGVGWMDPAMTWGAVGLYREAGLPYPYRSAALDLADRYAHPHGWIAVLHLPVKPFSTWQGVQLSHFLGRPLAAPDKVASYAEAVLCDPHADIQDLYYAARILASVKGDGANAFAALTLRLDSVPKGDMERQMEWLIPLVDLYPQLVEDDIRTELESWLHLCSDHAAQLDVQRIWEVIVLQALLGDEVIHPDDLRGMLLDLRFDRGFRRTASIPAPSLASTLYASDGLVRLGGLDESLRQEIIGFVEACRTDIGYLQRPPEYPPGPGNEELMYCLDALEILDLLRSLGS